MKIAVTGATGLLGNATAQHLLAQGHDVVAVDRREGEIAPSHPVIVGDLRDLNFCDSFMSGAEVPLHMLESRLLPTPRAFRHTVLHTLKVGLLLNLFP